MSAKARKGSKPRHSAGVNKKRSTGKKSIKAKNRRKTQIPKAQKKVTNVKRKVRTRTGTITVQVTRR